MLAALVSSVALAESVWEDDGSLTIIDSSEPTNISIDSSGSIKQKQHYLVMSQYLFMEQTN